MISFATNPRIEALRIAAEKATTRLYQAEAELETREVTSQFQEAFELFFLGYRLQEERGFEGEEMVLTREGEDTRRYDFSRKEDGSIVFDYDDLPGVVEIWIRLGIEEVPARGEVVRHLLNLTAESEDKYRNG